MSADPRDLWSRLAQPAALTAAGVFVVEGREAIARLLRTDHEVVSLLLTPAARVALQPHLDARAGGPTLPSDIEPEHARERPATSGRHARNAAVPDAGPVLPPAVLEVTPAQMREVTGFNFHRGALAMVRRPPMRSLEDLLEPPVAGGLQPLDRRPSNADGRSVFVVLEHLVDVDNVGSCFRNARAFGASAVLLDDRCADPLYRKAVRTSMGAVLELPWTVRPIAAILDALHVRGIATLALTPQAAADLASVLGDVADGSAIALVVGNEGDGLSGDTLGRCTHRARIPMAPGADSLNVATALALGLYQASGLNSQDSRRKPET